MRLICSSVFLSPLIAQPAPDKFWPQWRGPEANGVSRSATPPTAWSETRNVRWKIDLPGRGASSPVVWGDRVYLSTAIPASGGGARGPQRYMVMAVNRKDGKVAWQHTARRVKSRRTRGRTRSSARWPPRRW